jgi:predicted  nucleic acid-binding Zn-ribbon protein
MDESTIAIVNAIRDRQNAFEDQMARLRQDYQLEVAKSNAKWAEVQAKMAEVQAKMAEAQAKSDARWYDIQSDIKEMQFENQRILRWLERQQGGGNTQ